MAASSWNSLLIIIIFFFFFLMASCSADTNSFQGCVCGTSPMNARSRWAANLNAVFNSLAANVSAGGYYRAEAGRGSDRAFGLIQCRGDVSPTDCVECTRHSFALAAKFCGGSKTAVVWQRWCLLRYSNATFYGQWEGSGAAILPVNSTGLGDPAAADAGMNMVFQLAGDAPNAKSMFARSPDVGRSWKGYGLAQCTRDLARSDCGDCLNHFLKTFQSEVRNKTSWEIYGQGCFIQFDDHQFYFNSSISLGRPNSANAANTAWGGLFTILSGTMVMVIVTFF
ncbi:cysteine-rich repeat secretory protein 55-like [Andrographis paniculata]|uniref:cysteine-rich repeat secretory protein 55-like n=1 Tax=Andrographis paniculata TaxID=175694 RepID=UPI0021E78880|nr:cysteine-rich repeat secretory protein 55-like [Andrographis paniculata]XP_051125342.1 cysteine-rich repeat secretory protein 55-like [Andrographis paniculata]